MNPNETEQLDTLMQAFNDYYHRKLNLENFLRILNNIIGVATVLAVVMALIASKQLPNGKISLDSIYQIILVVLMIAFILIWLWQSFYHIPWFLKRWVIAHVKASDKAGLQKYQAVLINEKAENQAALKELQRERLGVDTQLDKLLSAPYQQLVVKQQNLVDRLNIIKKMMLYF